MKSILLNLANQIVTPRLIIRPPQMGDGIIVNTAILETFDKLHKVMPWAKTKPSIEESEEYARQAAANWILKKDEEPYLPLFIFGKDNNHFVGGTGYHHINWEVPCLEIGYWIREGYSGKGFITEAVNALTRYAISQLNVKRIEIRCDKNNLQSKKIPERLGYQLKLHYLLPSHLFAKSSPTFASYFCRPSRFCTSTYQCGTLRIYPRYGA